MSQQPPPHKWSKVEEERLAAEANKYPDPNNKWKIICGVMLSYANRPRTYDAGMCRSKWKRMVDKRHPLVAVKGQGNNHGDDKGVEEEEQNVAVSGRGSSHSSGGELAGYNGLSVPAARPPPGMTHDEAAARTRPRAGEDIWVPAGYDSTVPVASSGAAGAEEKDDDMTVVGTDGEEEEDEDDYATDYWNSLKPEQRADWKRKMRNARRDKSRGMKNRKQARAVVNRTPGMPEQPALLSTTTRALGENTEIKNAEAQEEKLPADRVVGVASGEVDEPMIYEHVGVAYGGGAQVEEQPLFPLPNFEVEEKNQTVGADYADGNGVDEHLLARVADATLRHAAARQGVTQQQWEDYLQSLGLTPPGYEVERETEYPNWLGVVFAWDRYNQYRPS